VEIEQRQLDRLRLQQLVIVALGASILDVLVTYFAVTRGWAQEWNPLAVRTFSAVGMQRTFALNLVLRLAIVGGLTWIAASATHRRARSAARVVLTGSAMWWTLVAVGNVLVLGAAIH
jgi:hypothetical protein